MQGLMYYLFSVEHQKVIVTQQSFFANSKIIVPLEIFFYETNGCHVKQSTNALSTGLT